MDFYLMRRQRMQQNLLAKKRLRKKLKSIRTNSNPFEIPDNVFHTLFRLEKQNVRHLVTVLEPKSRMTSIPFHIQVLATLHFYGQGSYQASVGSNYLLGLSQPCVSRCIENVTSLIHRYLAPIHIKFPTNILDKTTNKTRFYEKYGMSNIIGVVDGTQIAIIAPPENSIETPGNLYICRKGFHSLNVLVCCNADLRVIYADASFPGSAHDASIWKTSQLRMSFLNKFRSVTTQSEFILGDSGFPSEPWILVPFAQPILEIQNQFNKKLTSTRNCIEKCVVPRLFSDSSTRLVSFLPGHLIIRSPYYPLT